MGLHLPLNPVDAVNQPPLHYLQLQDLCILILGGNWMVAYVLYVKQGFKDKSYGMPLAALCVNIAWEFVFGILYPQNESEIFIFVIWLIIDMFISYTTIKHGKVEWAHAPLVADNLLYIIIFGSLWATAMTWCLVQTTSEVAIASYWAGFGSQLFLGTTSLAHLIARDSTKGHSMTIWWLRWIGSGAAIVMFSWRYSHYPADYPYVGTPMTVFLFVSFQVIDLTYPFVYMAVAKREAAREKAALKQS